MGAADRNRDAADDVRRRRVALAVAELAHEQRLRPATAAEICLRAGLPRNEFDRLFPSKQAAVRHAFAAAFASLFDPVDAAMAAAPSWLEGLARALDALMQAAAENSRLAELCLSYSLVVPGEVDGHDYKAAVDAVSKLLRVARTHAEAEEKEPVEAPPMAEEFLAHGILSRAAQLARRAGRETEASRSGDLLMLVLMTFYGTEDAIRLCAELEG